MIRLRHLSECTTRLAVIQEHGVESHVGFEQPDRRITIPKAQSLKLVCCLHVRHTEFEHGAGAIDAHGWRYPRAARVIKRDSEGQRPPVL